jgi:hypothetical protein
MISQPSALEETYRPTPYPQISVGVSTDEELEAPQTYLLPKQPWETVVTTLDAIRTSDPARHRTPHERRKMKKELKKTKRPMIRNKGVKEERMWTRNQVGWEIEFQHIIYDNGVDSTVSCGQTPTYPEVYFPGNITTREPLDALNFALDEYTVRGDIPSRVVYWTNASVLGGEVGAGVVLKDEPMLDLSEWIM